MPNRLAQETSPYLLQHQNNPVDWYPWGPEALGRSKSEEKPIFLSIGYSACHWCHVMEHESFENPAIAKLLNENFVCIKVDREERPDLDQIYMNAVQLLTGRGGWPMSMFLTPELRPFFGGTYWPPTARMGMPGFDQVLKAVLDAWVNRRDAVMQQSGELTEHLQSIGAEDGGESPSEAITPAQAKELLRGAEAMLERAFDGTNGGFGGAPKFPHSMDLQLLLRMWKRSPRPELLEMVILTLDKMAQGGIYDHLGGGFARYSVDERWLVPHFEKMLYDNALLLSAYLDAYVATREHRFAAVALETAQYIVRDMSQAEGGFFSTEDADSEGVEGKFYVWTPDEIVSLLGQERGEKFCYVYDVTKAGNFEHGLSILNLPKTIAQCAALRGWDVPQLEAELAEMRAELLAAREQRVHPGKDDKVLVGWNGLMIDALARAATLLKAPPCLEAAENAARFILAKMTTDDGRLLHTYRHGHAKLAAYLDDYAGLANALVTLYETTFDEHWIDEAVKLADVMLARFEDQEAGGFYFTADDHETLIARNKDLHDSSVPSGNSLAATCLLRLGKLTGRADYLESAERALRAGLPVMQKSPTAAGQMLIALEMYLGPMPEIAILADETQLNRALESFEQYFLPSRVITCRTNAAGEYHSPHLEPLWQGKEQGAIGPTVFICEMFACQAPITGEDEIAKLWPKL